MYISVFWQCNARDRVEELLRRPTLSERFVTDVELSKHAGDVLLLLRVTSLSFTDFYAERNTTSRLKLS